MPHPILGDLKVREAIASCIDRDALIAAAYPYVEDKASLRMDSFVPKTHWAYKGPYQDYPHDVAAAGKLFRTKPVGSMQKAPKRVLAFIGKMIRVSH